MPLNRSQRLRIALSATALTLAAAPAASANVWTDVNNFNLTETASFYPTSWNTSSNTTGIEFRWLDTPSKATYIRAYSCATGAPLASSDTYFPAGSSGTTYRTVGSQSPALLQVAWPDGHRRGLYEPLRRTRVALSGLEPSPVSDAELQ